MKITVKMLKPLITLVINFLIRVLEKYSSQTQTEYDDLAVQFLKEALPVVQNIINELE